jgi:hypothetical protein
VILSRREKWIARATGAAIGLFVLDYVALSPLMARRADLADRVARAEGEVRIAEQTVDRGKVMSQRWQEMTAAGLGADASAAEAQALHALRDWAQDAGLSLTSLKPERTERVKQFNQITIRATGQGNLRSVGRFLYHIQAGDIPVRVTDFQIAARKEGTDDLTLQLGVSTIALAPPEKPRPGARALNGQGGAR